MLSICLKKIIFPLAVLSFSQLFFCGKEATDQPKEEILVRIGNKTISKNEFISRAELTLRPSYCKGDNYIHRKIVLNSLVAEKLLALELGENSELAQNERFQDYVRGRKEQAMRQYLFSKDFYKKVELDSGDLKNEYRFANRTYQIEYTSVTDTEKVKIIKDHWKRGSIDRDLFPQSTASHTISRKEIKWDDPEPEVIHEALFREPLYQNQIIGPLKFDNNSFLLIKICSWTDRLLISDQDVQKKMFRIERRLKERYAAEAYKNFVLKLMKGRRVEFNGKIFTKLLNLLQPLYVGLQQNNTNLFNNDLGQQKSQEKMISSVRSGLERIGDLSFLTIDKDVWTVRDFEKELNVHPLVFGERINKGNFAEQFKLAVINLIQDKYVTGEAYKNGYEKVNVVRRTVTMWRDYLLASYQKNQYLQSINQAKKYSSDYLSVIKNDLNPYIETLQKKYNNDIEIDLSLFEKLKLTRVDLLAIEKNMPFPVLVPDFPLVTTNHKLDYGKKMER